MAGFRNDVVYANNADFSTAGAVTGSAANGLNTDGQLWIGTTTPNVGGTHISVGTLTSPDASVTIGYDFPNITLQSVGGSQSSTKITTYEFADSPAVWTKSTNPPPQWIEVYLWAGGAGGGSGRKGTSTASGGGSGGGAGGVGYYTGVSALFGVTENVVIGEGGLGGAPQSADLTNGNTGQAFSGDTSFGNMLVAGGAVGKGGTTTSATGSSSGGSPTFTSSITALVSGVGSNSSPSSALNIGSTNLPGGQFRSSGGGGGSGYDLVVARQASSGQSNVKLDGSVILAGGAGGIETGTINGGDGNPGISSGGLMTGGTGGGGGGGPSAGTTPGNGGNGAVPGGGGGGGGGGISGVADSGAGGNGAPGRIIVIEHF